MYRFDGSFNPSENKNNQSSTHCYVFIISSIQWGWKKTISCILSRFNKILVLWRDQSSLVILGDLAIGESRWSAMIKIIQVVVRSSPERIDDIYQSKSNYYVSPYMQCKIVPTTPIWTQLAAIPAYLSANQKDPFKYELVVCCKFKG